MEFNIVVGNDSEYLQELDCEIRDILSRYPHKLAISKNARSVIYCIKSDSKSFVEMKYKVVFRSISYMLYWAKQKYYGSELAKFLSCDMQFILNRILIFSEFEQESMILFEKLKDQNIVVLDGIYNFMTSSFKGEWKRACTVINLGSIELKNADNFKEFIKSMSSSISSKYDILYLFCGLKNTVLSDKLEKIPATFLSVENLSSEQKVISTLIENYPLNVAIYEESKAGMINDALKILFDVRKTAKSTKSV